MILPINYCINALPSDERQGVSCFYGIRLTSRWYWTLCLLAELLLCQVAFDGLFESLVSLRVFIRAENQPEYDIKERHVKMLQGFVKLGPNNTNLHANNR